MSQLDFMDSTGIGFMIGRYHDLRKIGGRIIICSMNSMIERIFNLPLLSNNLSNLTNELNAAFIVGSSYFRW